eukprot:758959-Hanusia_phi.AAC.2
MSLFDPNRFSDDKAGEIADLLTGNVEGLSEVRARALGRACLESCVADLSEGFRSTLRHDRRRRLFVLSMDSGASSPLVQPPPALSAPRRSPGSLSRRSE